MKLRRRPNRRPPADEQRHNLRVLAAVVAKTGPVAVHPSQYTDARPEQLSAVLVPDLTVDPCSSGQRDDPMVFALPEHFTDDGLVTMEQRIVDLLGEHAGDSLLDQARAVLTALGLPVTPRADTPEVDQ